jgi:hypothetical protein
MALPVTFAEAATAGDWAVLLPHDMTVRANKKYIAIFIVVCFGFQYFFIICFSRDYSPYVQH